MIHDYSQTLGAILIAMHNFHPKEDLYVYQRLVVWTAKKEQSSKITEQHYNLQKFTQNDCQDLRFKYKPHKCTRQQAKPVMHLYASLVHPEVCRHIMLFLHKNFGSTIGDHERGLLWQNTKR